MGTMWRTRSIAGLTLVTAAMLGGLPPVEASHENGHMVIESGPLRMEFERVGIFIDQAVSTVAVDTAARKVGQVALVRATFDAPSVVPDGILVIPMVGFGFQDACDIIRDLPTVQSCEKIPGTVQNLHAVQAHITDDAFVSCVHHTSLTVSFAGTTILQTNELKEVVNGPCGSPGMVGGFDEAPNSCTEELPVVQPDSTVSGTVVNGQDRHDFFALQIGPELINHRIAVEMTSLMRLDASIPTPAFLRVWSPDCSGVIVDALPNGEVSDIAFFVPLAPARFPVEVFLGEQGSEPIQDPLLAGLDEFQCLVVENGGEYWNCPGAADQYTFKAFSCEKNPGFPCIG